MIFFCLPLIFISILSLISLSAIRSRDSTGLAFPIIFIIISVFLTGYSIIIAATTPNHCLPEVLCMLIAMFTAPAGIIGIAFSMAHFFTAVEVRKEMYSDNN